MQQSVKTKTRNYARHSQVLGIDANIQKRLTFIGMSQQKVALKKIEELEEISSETSSLETDSEASQKTSHRDNLNFKRSED